MGSIFAAMVLALSIGQLHAATALNLATYNIRTYGKSEGKAVLTATNKRVLKSILKDTNADLIAVQEIIDDEDFISFISSNFSNYRVHLSKCGGGGHQKLGFIYDSSRLKLNKTQEDFRIKEKKGCDEGMRPLMVGWFSDFKTRREFIAIAVHLKAGGRPANIEQRYRQIAVMNKVLRDYKRRNSRFVIMGDFNTTEYLSRGYYYEKFIDFVDNNRLVDMSTSIDCSSYWWGGVDDGIHYSSLLDHILMSDDFWRTFNHQEVEVQAHCKRFSCRQQPEDSLGLSFKEVSDHCPVVATLR